MTPEAPNQTGLVEAHYHGPAVTFQKLKGHNQELK
jgi:hypothetical protein